MTDADEMAELERAVEQTIAECDGSARSAVRVLIFANRYLEAEVERLAEAVSKGYARGQVTRLRIVGKAEG